MKTAPQLAAERKEAELKAKPCKCDSYKFPHRRFGGQCNDDLSWMTFSQLMARERCLDKEERYV